MRSATENTQLPAPPQAPSPEDFPAVPTVEPPRLPPTQRLGLLVALGVAVAAAAAVKWLSAGTIEPAPILFVVAVAAPWWLGRQVGLALAAGGGAAWTAAAFASPCRWRPPKPKSPRPKTSRP